MQGSLITETIYPFGRGSTAVITSATGMQYSASVSTAGSTAFVTVEEATIELPEKAVIKELIVGLTQGLSITITTDAPSVRYLVKNNANSSYDTLLASTSIVSTVSTTTLVDDTRWVSMTPTTGTNFTGLGTFQLQGQVMSGATTSKAQGGMKNSSYVQYSYYLIG